MAPRGVAVGREVTYLGAKEKAVEVENLYASRNVRLPARCGLAVLIEAAKAACDARLTGKERRMTAAQFYQIIHLDRVADAVLSGLIGDDRTTEEALRRLTKGRLSLCDRKEFSAKDVLWELERNALFNRMSIPATLEEPPDIMLNLHQQFGVTCKKVNSDKHFSNTLSKRVSQLVGDHSQFGMIAVNLDDNLPPNTIRVATNPESPFQRTNPEFIEKASTPFSEIPAATSRYCDSRNHRGNRVRHRWRCEYVPWDYRPRTANAAGRAYRGARANKG